MQDYNEYLKKTFIDEGNIAIVDYESHFQTSVWVCFKIDVKKWRKLRSKGQLGLLYNTDLSNFLSRIGRLNFYAAPVVNDRSRAKDGLKTIKVEFRKKA